MRSLDLRALSRPPRPTKHNSPHSPYDDRGRYRVSRYRYMRRREQKQLAELWFFTLNLAILACVVALLTVAHG